MAQWGISMSDILSTISQIFSKAFILGTFIPVALFAVMSWLLTNWLIPANAPFFTFLRAIDIGPDLIALSSVLFVLSTFLYNLFPLISSIYEGRLWTDRWLGKYLIANNPAMDREEILKLLRADPAAGGANSPIVTAEKAAVNDLVRPTRLGNSIEQYWAYAERRYGIDGRVLWPRLVSVIEKDYLSSIENAQASLRFMLNCSVLSIILAVAFPVVILLYARSLRIEQQLAGCACVIAAGLSMAYLCYLGAIQVAGEWGDTLKGAFDLYRNDLLGKLGYKRARTTQTEERDLWKAISDQTNSPGSAAGQVLDYEPVTPPALLMYARSDGDSAVQLETARGIEPDGDGRYITIVLWIKNLGAKEKEAQNVIVTDTLSDEYDYKWGSAKRFSSPQAEEDAGIPVKIVVGTNPYHFHIDAIEEEAIVKYTAVVRKPAIGSGANRSTPA